MTVTGETLGERLAGDAKRAYVDRSIIAETDKPLEPTGGLVALFGNLAPQGAILKRSAADAKLFEHEGRAVVFSSLEDLAARIDDPKLDVEPDDILVLQNAGPHAPACMPEAGYLPIPKKLAQKGVKDMVRISDARMSGTAFGTIVLHVTPDAASGGPLGLVKNGDRIRLSVKERRITLLVDDAELKKRAAAAPAHVKIPERGYAKLFAEQITGADEGCDFRFLMPRVIRLMPREGGASSNRWRTGNTGSSASRTMTARPLSSHRDLQRKIVDHLVAFVGHDKSVAEENAEQPVRRDRIGLGHDDHAGLEHFLEFFRADVLGDDMRLVGDEIDAVALRRPRLVAVVAEKFAGLPHVLRGLAGRDLGDDLVVAGQRDRRPRISAPSRSARRGRSASRSARCSRDSRRPAPY